MAICKLQCYKALADEVSTNFWSSSWPHHLVYKRWSVAGSGFWRKVVVKHRTQNLISWEISVKCKQPLLWWKWRKTMITQEHYSAVISLLFYLQKLEWMDAIPAVISWGIEWRCTETRQDCNYKMRFLVAINRNIIYYIWYTFIPLPFLSS